jgi:hypothetical protein
MIYIGYLVSFETAVSLFPWAELSSEREFEESLKQYNLVIDYIDKGQCILGVSIPELSDKWDVFVHVDDAIMRIIQTKKTVIDAFKKANANLREFDLQPMEGEPVRVYNPEPYLISV